MEAITELNDFKRIVKQAAIDLLEGKIDFKKAQGCAALGNTYQKFDNGIVQRLKLRKKTTCKK